MNKDFNIVVLPGDGIGVEVIDATLALLERVQERHGFVLHQQRHPGGARHYRDTGNAFPDSSMRACEEADAILFGAMGWPEIRYPDGTEIAPQLDMRVHLDLYAGVRPIRAIPGLPLPLSSPRAKDIDLVIVRESTEGWFHARGRGIRGQTEQGAEAVRDTCEISRPACERLFDFSFRLAAQRKKRNAAKGKVTCVDKSNVFLGMAFMNQIFYERAAAYPGVEADHCYIDAYCLNLIRKPWDFDVCPMEPVRRHHLRPRRGPDLRHGLCALGRHRRQACGVPALARQRAGHRRQGDCQSDRHLPERGDDAGVAGRAPRCAGPGGSRAGDLGRSRSRVR